MLTFGHDGRGIRPSVNRVAWMCGKTDRRIRADIAELIDRRVLRVVRKSVGGRGKTTEYAFDVDALPVRASYENPDAHVRVNGQKPGRGDAETMTSETENPDVHVRGSKILIDQIEDQELRELNDPAAIEQRKRDRARPHHRRPWRVAG